MPDDVIFETRLADALGRYADLAPDMDDAVIVRQAMAADGWTRRLGWLSNPAPSRRLAAVVDEIQTVPHRGRWRSRRLATGALLVGVALAIAIAASQLTPRAGLVGPGATSPPTPSPSASPSPSPTASPSSRATLPTSLGPVTVLESMGSEGLLANVTYTSNRFQPAVTFSLPVAGYGAPETDWCSPRHSTAPKPRTSPRTIVLAYRAGCVSDLRVIRPWAVDCGQPGAHPSAASLATALLTRFGTLGVTDLGTLQTVGAVPPTLFRGSYSGRVIRIDGQAQAFQGSVIDPDQCRLLPEPGSGDPTIEVRSDMAALLVLLDVHDELLILRVADGGYDAPTGSAARDRGYGVSSPPDLLDRMLSQIHDIEFK